MIPHWRSVAPGARSFAKGLARGSRARRLRPAGTGRRDGTGGRVCQRPLTPPRPLVVQRPSPREDQWQRAVTRENSVRSPAGVFPVGFPEGRSRAGRVIGNRGPAIRASQHCHHISHRDVGPPTSRRRPRDWTCGTTPSGCPPSVPLGHRKELHHEASPEQEHRGLHARRAARRDRHHRAADLHPAPVAEPRPRDGQPHQVRGQPAVDRAVHAALQQREQPAVPPPAVQRRHRRHVPDAPAAPTTSTAAPAPTRSRVPSAPRRPRRTTTSRARCSCCSARRT